MKKWNVVKGVLLTVILAAAFAGPLLAGDGVSAAEGGGFYGTIWALLPPVIAIGLALITKEVYSSLFVGILMGGLLYSAYSFEGTVLHVFQDGIVGVLSDGYNIGILVFLVILGAMVSLMNKAGGSAAFGRWAAQHIKSRVGAQLATVALGVLIFIDDYFNCLTVGSVMRPVTDKHRVSRAKLAYLIDATAAPVCIIAPISSWAAAVASYVEDGNGLTLFIRAIPFNYYAILTIVMMIGMAVMKLEFGPMAKYEEKARFNGDLFNGRNPYAGMAAAKEEKKGIVLDLVLPIAVLILCCVIGMIYSGGFFEGASFVEAFSNSDASVGLMLGSVFALAFTVIYYCLRKTMTFRETMDCIPEGFRAMVPAILILTFAWSLKAMTDSLGAGEFVAGVVKSSAGAFQAFLPGVVFLIGCFLAFATGTSWGTFGILIPITLNVFSLTDPLGVVCVSACMAGAVCGDHCSPISDTTIMASAGAQCDHVDHVSTQLPYAVVAAAVSFVAYLIAGFVPNALIMLPVAILLMAATLFGIRMARGGNRSDFRHPTVECGARVFHRNPRNGLRLRKGRIVEKKDILKIVDHTLLAQTATWTEIRQILDDGMKFGTASACIPVAYVRQAAEYVAGRLPVCTVIGFPNGYSTTAVKVFETKDAVANGAQEIDMVINIGYLKDHRYQEVEDEIRQVHEACGGRILKVIIETCLLTEEEKIKMCGIVTKAGAEYIKTSTGFSSAGATFADVKLMRTHVGKEVKIKAAGGISSFEDAEEFMRLGADRLGTSRLIKIMKDTGTASGS